MAIVDREAHKDEINVKIINVTSAAKALIAHATKLNKKISIPDYDKRKEKLANNKNAFIKDLRNCYDHEEYFTFIHQTTISGTERSHDFIVKKEKLSRSNQFTAPSKEFINSCGDSIGVKLLFRDYHADIIKFYDWWLGEIKNNIPETLQDYRRCQREIAKVQKKSWYNLILNRAIQINSDPYEFIDKHFSQKDIEIINTLPKHSKEQVDKIIELEDEYGACDEELRELVYKVFKVTG